MRGHGSFHLKQRVKSNCPIKGNCVVCGFFIKQYKKIMLKIWKKSLKWAGMAVLFSRQLPNGSHIFFQTFSIYFKDNFIKNPQTTISLPFLTHNISAIGDVYTEKISFLKSLLAGWKSFLLFQKKILCDICPYGKFLCYSILTGCLTYEYIPYCMLKVLLS